jgi:CheY-like chemotaxis protein
MAIGRKAGFVTLVLVVEDWPRTNFNWLGYEVVSAFNADEATEVLESRGDIGPIFTDIDMP